MLQPAQLLQEAQQQLDIFRPSIFEFGANLFIALFCGTLISLVYRFIRRKATIPPAFPNALVLLCLITAIITLVIGNNLARAFGLVGTMSIIRFRTAVRDVEDIVFIFFSLAMGMAAGVGLNSIALIGTVLICVVILLLHTFSDTERKEAPLGYLQITHEAAALPQLQELLRKHGRRIKLLNAQPNGESLYQLALRRPKKQEDFLKELREIESVSSVNFFFEPEAKD
ncbi:MAG: DUF4956 domain-containing protein [Acidobacteria bacterium]|nr:DUF4956 domain-containing protein [Acidobacteriota bacterium]